jgi:hypothetical protein
LYQNVSKPIHYISLYLLSKNIFIFRLNNTAITQQYKQTLGPVGKSGKASTKSGKGSSAKASKGSTVPARSSKSPSSSKAGKASSKAGGGSAKSGKSGSGGGSGKSGKASSKAEKADEPTVTDMGTSNYSTKDEEGDASDMASTTSDESEKVTFQVNVSDADNAVEVLQGLIDSGVLQDLIEAGLITDVIIHVDGDVRRALKGNDDEEEIERKLTNFLTNKKDHGHSFAGDFDVEDLKNKLRNLLRDGHSLV